MGAAVGGGRPAGGVRRRTGVRRLPADRFRWRDPVSDRGRSARRGGRRHRHAPLVVFRFGSATRSDATVRPERHVSSRPNRLRVANVNPRVSRGPFAKVFFVSALPGFAHRETPVAAAAARASLFDRRGDRRRHSAAGGPGLPSDEPVRRQRTLAAIARADPRHRHQPGIELPHAAERRPFRRDRYEHR